MLQAWEARVGPLMDKSQGSLPCEPQREENVPGGNVPDVPIWVEALLLILDVMAQTQPKQAQRAQTAAGAYFPPLY